MTKIHIKTEEEIQKMRVAGRLAAQVLEMIEPYVKPEVTTQELNDRCHRYIVEELKAIPAPLNYHGFPKSICTSINYVVCHGIPNDKPLKRGDILNIDITVIKDAYHGDTSKMFIVGGDCTLLAKRLVDAAHEAMWRGIKIVKPGAHFGDIGYAIQSYVENLGYSVVQEYCGHGIGTEFHEEALQVLHFGHKGSGLRMEKGMTFTVEPMINAGDRHIKLLNDHWTVVTKDRSLSAQWEHTVLVTDHGFEVLTLRQGEVIPA